MTEQQPEYPLYPTEDAAGYPPPRSRPPSRSSWSPRRTVLVAAVVAALVGGGVGAGTVAAFENPTPTAASAGLSVHTQAAPAAKVDGTVSAAAAKIGPSVVTITVVSGQQQDTGSGVIIRSDGYLLTNNHVIANGVNGRGSIGVTLADGRQSSAKVVGTDPSDDLAVIKVPLSGLTAASFASSHDLVVGQSVLAVGAPLGLSDTVTAGIVSNTARPVQTGNSAAHLTVFDAVQTDAAINPGNSGGPLVDLNGDVVGINAAIATDQSQGGLQVPGQSQAGNIGIGFAIPSDEARRIAGQLITTGTSTHALLGVTVTDAGGQAAAVSGARVSSVTPGGPAAKAGLRAGDVITKVDDQRIDTADALVAATRSHAPGQAATITYLRGSSSKTVPITLGSDPN